VFFVIAVSGLAAVMALVLDTYHSYLKSGKEPPRQGPPLNPKPQP
jgi:hypothetical protein